MKLAQSTIDRPTLTCSICPFARYLDGNRYVCGVSETAADVVRGHWEAKVNCHEAIAQAPATAPVPATPSTSTPATLSAKKTAPTPTPAPTAIGTDDEPPNRGDNGRGRVQPMPAKKLMLSIVPVKRITSDIPATNFDQFELEVLGELSLAIGGFIVPPVLVRDSSGYKVISGHLQYHAAVLARQLNPRAGETIPAIVLESENQTTASAMLKMLKFAA